MGALANLYRVDAHGKTIKGAIGGPIAERELKPHRSTEKAASGREASGKGSGPSDGDKALRVEIARLGMAVTEQDREISRLKEENTALKAQLMGPRGQYEIEAVRASAAAKEQALSDKVAAKALLASNPRRKQKPKGRR